MGSRGINNSYLPPGARGRRSRSRQNIAEGMAKRSFKDRTRFLEVAQGSLSELDTQMEVAKRLKLVSDEIYDKLMDLMEEIQRLLSGLIKKYS
jgi:four helix bundle protein